MVYAVPRESKCTRAEHPIAQDIQISKVTNANNNSSKTASPQNYAATLTNRQVETRHYTVSLPAPRLYLILPEPMTETSLWAQLKQYGPIKSLPMIEKEGPSNNGGIVKMATKAFKGCDPA